MPTDPTAPPGPTGGAAGLPTNRKAIYSVILGAVAFPWLFIYPFFAFVLAVPSVTCGVFARREIRDAKGTEGGDMTAVVGLTIGATTLVFVLITWVTSSYVTG
jgi:hypothetical protein